MGDVTDDEQRWPHPLSHHEYDDLHVHTRACPACVDGVAQVNFETVTTSEDARDPVLLHVPTHAVCRTCGHVEPYDAPRASTDP